MKREELKVILNQSAVVVERQSGCPADDELASFMDGGLSEQGHETFTIHLADCAFCIERIGMLGRARDADLTDPVPELLLARSRKLAAAKQPPSQSKRAWENAAPWAAAAVVVLAIGLLATRLPGPDPDVGIIDQTDPGFRDTRTINPGALGPRILWPQENFPIVAREAVFKWSPVPDSLFYEIRIVSDEGDLLWQERVIGTQWGLPPDFSLAPDAEYFVRVDAFLNNSKSLNSDFIPFRTGEQD